MKNLNENMGGKIEIEFQDWLDEMNDKDYPERLTLETVIEYSQNTLRGGKNKGGKIEIEFQDWLDMMYKDYPKIETLETVIEYSQDTLRDYDLDDWVPQGQSTSESKKIESFDLKKYLAEGRLTKDDNFTKNERLIQFIKDINSLRRTYMNDIRDNALILDSIDTLNNLIQKEIK